MGRKVAIIIALNYTKIGKQWELYGCVNDALQVQNMLMDAYNFKEKDITFFRDDIDSNTYWPTYNNIYKALFNAVSTLEEDDELWFHCSSHGDRFTDYGINETDNADEHIIIYDNNKKNLTYFLDDDFNKLLSKSVCKVHMFFDTCNSGTMGDLQYNFTSDITRERITDDKTFIVSRSKENLQEIKNKNIICIATARDYELATDGFSDRLQQSMGAGTMALLYCLRQSSHIISYPKLLLDMTLYMKENKYSQNPQLTSSARTLNGGFNKYDNISIIDVEAVNIKEIENNSENKINIEIVDIDNNNNNNNDVRNVNAKKNTVFNNKKYNLFKMMFI